MNESLNETRININYNEFFTQINELNRLSELPDEISFSVSTFSKMVFYFLFLLGASLGFYFFFKGMRFSGIFIFTSSIILPSILYFFDNKKRNQKYTINKNGVKVDAAFYPWDEIEDLHLKCRKTGLGSKPTFICFTFQSNNKEFLLDSMNKSTPEIVQILYMYNKLWIKNNQGKPL